MNNTEASHLVNEIFTEISNAQTIERLEDIIDQSAILQRNKMNPETYPPLELSLSTDEINQLMESMLLQQDKYFPAALSTMALSPLEKLLYSILWKNGDLKKVHLIVSGILDADNDQAEPEGESVVFYHFGRHLANRQNPIIDQHIIRAFLAYTGNRDEIEHIRSLRSVSKKHSEVIVDYKAWLTSNEINPLLLTQHSYASQIDKVLIALGKAIRISA